MTAEFRDIAKALEYLPSETVIDGEVAALDEHGRPSFNLLQNFRSSASRIVYFAFDIMSHNGRDLTRLSLSRRRSLLQKVIQRRDCIEIAESTNDLERLERFVNEWKLEGIVAKHADSLYETGQAIWSVGQEAVRKATGVCRWWLHAERSGSGCFARRLLCR